MEIEFTDKITGDTWTEHYNSLEEIKPELLEGVTYKIIEKEDDDGRKNKV